MRIHLRPIGDPQTSQVFIGGQVFDIDHRLKWIYPPDRPGAGLIIRHAEPANGPIPVVYDSKTESLYLQPATFGPDQRIVHLPPRLFEGPITDEKELNKINEKNFREEAGFVVVSKALYNRLEGKLPVLDLVGDKYVVDIRMDVLKSAKNFEKTIPLDAFTSRGENNYGFYDKKSKSMFYFDPEQISKTPPHVYYVEFPAWNKIDPVGLARIKNIDLPLKEQNDARYLNEIEMIVSPAATFKHISETPVAAMIKQNRKRDGLPAERIILPRAATPKLRRT